MAVEALLARLAPYPVSSRLRVSQPMADYTSFRIGGPADILAQTACPDEIALLAYEARRVGLPCTLIGLGTNLLVLDGGIRGLVIQIGPAMSSLEWDHGTGSVVAGAGIALSDLAAAVSLESYAGLEFAEGIPGTLGGALVMNAGAYGGEIGGLVRWVDVVDLSALDGPTAGPATRRLSGSQLGFGYRASSLQKPGLAAVSACLQLSRGCRHEIEERMAELAARRRSRQPLEYPSAGSFFVRPPGRYTGPLIEECGLKGFRIGGAEVSTKHANFIINAGGATAADVLAVACEVRRQVRGRFEIDLQLEVRVIGEPLPYGSGGS